MHECLSAIIHMALSVLIYYHIYQIYDKRIYTFLRYIYSMMLEVVRNKGAQKFDHLQTCYVTAFGGYNKHVHYVRKTSVLFATVSVIQN